MPKTLTLATLAAVLVAGAGLLAADPPLEKLTLPPGFQIEVYADDVENARQMALSPDGTLFISTRQAGNVYAVRDDDGDQKADRVVTIASGLQMPNGVAFHDGALYVAEVSRVLRHDGIETRLDSPPEPVVLNDGLPSERMQRLEVSRLRTRRQALRAGGCAVQRVRPYGRGSTLRDDSPDEPRRHG